MANDTNALKEKMVEALELSYGIITNACKMVGINRCTHYEWIKTDPDYARRCEGSKEAAIDFVESCLFKQIRDGIPASTIFYLKTIGKSRGFVERNELQLSGSIEIKKPSWFDDTPINELHILLPKQAIEETAGN